MNGQANGMSSDPFRETLAVRATEKRQEWDRLVAQQAAIAKEMARVREYVASLNALLMAEGLPPIDITESVPRSRRGASVGARGSAATPDRREEYASMTLADAIETVLKDAGELHANDLVRQIFVIESPADLRGGKQNLVSTLSRQAGKRGWIRSPGKKNTYKSTLRQEALV